jgi:hypothetical protein
MDPSLWWWFLTFSDRSFENQAWTHSQIQVWCTGSMQHQTCLTIRCDLWFLMWNMMDTGKVDLSHRVIRSLSLRRMCTPAWLVSKRSV